jgi:hypothetical protein
MRRRVRVRVSAPKPASSAPAATIDAVAQVITDHYGDSLLKLKFAKPFDIAVYSSTHKADVSGTPGVIGFRTATSNTGKLLIIPDDADNSARAMASVGCG